MAKGAVTCEERSDSLVLYQDEGVFERLLYFVPCASVFPDIDSEKPVVIEEPDSNDRNAPWKAELFDKLSRYGWVLAAHNLQVSTQLSGREAELDKAFEEALAKVACNGITLDYCSPQQADAVRSLWRDFLKPTDIPAEHLAFDSNPTQSVICAMDEANHVCGVNWWEIKSSICEIRHTVTAPERLHQGIGYAMLMTALVAAAKSKCKSVYTYIDQVNERSLRLYAKAGITPNGKTVTQYLLERKD